MKNESDGFNVLLEWLFKRMKNKKGFPTDKQIERKVRKVNDELMIDVDINKDLVKAVKSQLWRTYKHFQLEF